ncbi:MAG: hypothetical protein ACRD3J_12160 [Thermoanaerobaculia bacterium]
MRISAVFAVLCLVFVSAAGESDSSLSVGGGSITIKYSENVPIAFRKLVEEWVHDAADSVIAVYGRYSVKQVTIDVRVTSGNRASGGRTFDGRLIKIRVGSDVTREILRSDWVMTHEMFHLGFPDTVNDWMGEGLSTYIEPLARARIGNLSEKAVWESMVDGLPKGLPQAGDQGLDRTPTWGRTYWGGALFWMLADIEIRKQSGNRKSLDDVLRAILAEDGTGSSYWPEAKIISRGDAAIGMPILSKLHERLGNRPESTDLDALWRQLGVVRRGREVTFDDSAPLAGIRRAMTSGK